VGSISPALTIRNCAFCNYGLSVILSINGSYPKQRQPTVLYNGEVLCFHCGTDLILTYCLQDLRLQSVIMLPPTTYVYLRRVSSDIHWDFSIRILHKLYFEFPAHVLHLQAVWMFFIQLPWQYLVKSTRYEVLCYVIFFSPQLLSLLGP
jgi:hypothetical protein